MISRTSGILLMSYILIFLGGLGYLLTPSPTVDEASTASVETVVWGAFYVAGGAVAALAAGIRPFMLRRITSLWYFEISGISLIISANLVYAYSLYHTSLETGYINQIALAAVLIAFSLALVARSVEVLSLIRYLSQYASNDDNLEVDNG
jgi:hypothetical protein